MQRPRNDRARAIDEMPVDDGHRYIGDIGEALDTPQDKATVGLPLVALALLLGFAAGAAVWILLKLSGLMTQLVWIGLRDALGFAWFPLVACTLGGIVIGIAQRFGIAGPMSLERVMGDVKRDGSYDMPSLVKGIVGFLLPLIFGGSVGPEAGLTGIIASACTRIGDMLKRAGVAAKEVVELSVPAVLTAVFAAPFLGVAACPNYDATRGGGYAFRRRAKILLYTAAAFGAFAGVYLLGALTSTRLALPRFEVMDASWLDCLWVPLLFVAGYLLALLYHLAERGTGFIGDRLSSNPVAACAICGICLGACGMVLPDVLFSGEEQVNEIMGTWELSAPAVLMLTGVVKTMATPLCLNLGWRGGHFFPLIFAGVSFGYGMAALTGADSVLCVTVVATTLMAAVIRRPVITLGLFVLIFPFNGIIWMGLCAVIGASLPMPRVALGRRAS